ncbi:MAG: peptidoglycan-binding protein, partial [candidate division NC10 bacterium]|nr:peptidoglycan-binding protein [candidate division NC10 bacterium]
MVWTSPPPRPGHPYYMHDAIYAQPGAIRLVLRTNAEILKTVAGQEDIRAVEMALQKEGLNPGTIDGKADAQLEAAVREFQAKRGLPQT